MERMKVESFVWLPSVGNQNARAAATPCIGAIPPGTSTASAVRVERTPLVSSRSHAETYVESLFRIARRSSSVSGRPGPEVLEQDVTVGAVTNQTATMIADKRTVRGRRAGTGRRLDGLSRKLVWIAIWLSQ